MQQDGPLITTAIDFTKAFDSIDRKKMIETLIKDECHQQLISVLTKLYSGDKTKLFIGGEEIYEMEVKNGIQ